VPGWVVFYTFVVTRLAAVGTGDVNTVSLSSIGTFGRTAGPLGPDAGEMRHAVSLAGPAEAIRTDTALAGEQSLRGRALGQLEPRLGDHGGRQ
jgi:hypothetical protein